MRGVFKWVINTVVLSDLSSPCCVRPLLWVSFAAFAAPASWYKWKSKIKDAEVCSQTFRRGLERTAGSYRDGRCEKIKMNDCFSFLSE